MRRATIHFRLILTIPALLLPGLLFAPSSFARQQQGVYVANQGNFTDNNGSITFYDPATGQATEVLSDFGTLVQSIMLYDGKGYVMSNTSEAIDVIDLATQQRVSQIPSVSSPRYMAVVDAPKAYVSNLYNATVTIVDLAAGTLLGTIETGSNPEDIAVVGARAYVANFGFGSDSTLTVIDTQTDTVLDTIDLGCDGPRHLEVDAEDELWAFCVGNTVYNEDYTEIISQTNGEAVVLNGATGEILTRFELAFQVGATSFGQDTYYAAATHEIFLVHGTDLLVFDTAGNTQQATITLSGEESVGGIAYDAAAARFYAARVTDFSSAGFVSIHGRDGQEVARFDAGVAPGHVALLQPGLGTATEHAGEAVPDGFALHQNYPNPFNPTTTLSFDITVPGRVTLKIYDALGRVVATPVDATMTPGHYEATWDAGSLAGGVYLSRLEADGRVAIRHLVLVK